MTAHRLEIRPIASRRLRAALLFVFLLGLAGLAQTRLSNVELFVALLTLTAIFIDGLRRTRVPCCTLIFEPRPLACRLIDTTGVEIALRGTRSSVYPWLIVLRLEPAQAGTESAADGAIARWLKYPVVLLPDSLATPSKDSWRHLLVWSQQLRRTLANGQDREPSV